MCIALSRALSALALAALIGCGQGGPSDAEQIASAKALLEKNDLKGAVIQLKNAIQKNPKSAEARFLLGKTLLEGGDPVTANVELLKAQELQTADELVIPELARAMLQVGDEAKLLTQYGSVVLRDDKANADLKTSLATASAIKDDMGMAHQSIEQALRAKPGYAPALIVKARLAANESDLDGALAILDQVLAADPANERAGSFKAEILLQAKRDPAAAIASYRKVLEANPSSVAARSSLANILFQQQKIAEARVEFDLLKKSAPENPETLFLEAELAFNDGKLKAAREICERLLKNRPDNVRVLELAGATELRAKNYLQAEAHLGRAMKVAPKLLRPRLLLTQTFVRSGQADKALELLKPILESKQADAASLSLAGEAYLQTGDIKRSEEAFRLALKAAPGNAAVRTSAAIAQIAGGNTSSSATAELEAVASGDKGPRADLALISMRLRQNDIPGALKAIDAVEKKLPDQPLAYLLRGRVLLLKKDVPGAARSFETALSKDAAYFPAVASLAAIDLASGKPELARERFTAHLKANPQAFQAKLALAELDARTGAPAATVVGSLKDAAKINPIEPMPHLMLINRLLAGGDGKGALQAAEDGTAALPNNLEIMDALGRAQMAAGDAQRSITTFKKLTSLQPRNALFQLHLAEAYRANKDVAGATAALRQAIELQPDMVPALRTMASLAVQDSRTPDALTIARGLQQRKPKDASGFMLEGEIEASRKGWDAAATAFRGALQRSRTVEAAINLHSALRAGGKTAEADRLAAEWQKDNPKDAVFIYYLGDLALASNDFAGAEARYRSVMEIQPNNALAINNVAWLLARQNKPGGVALAEKATGLLPDRAPLLDTLSMAQEVENQLPKAIETQLRAVRLAGPGDPGLTLRLAKLYIKSGDKVRARAELESLTKLGDKFAGQAEVASLLKTL